MRYMPPKKKFPYGELIHDSFRISWAYKFLWFFGLFAGGYASFGSFNFSNFRSSSNSGNSKSSKSVSDAGKEITDWISAHVGLIVAVVAALIVLGIIIWLWSLVCRGAVIGSVRDVREGRQISFKTAFANGRRSFTRLLLLDLFLLVIGFGVVIIISAIILLVIFLAASGPTGGVILTILSLFIAPLFVVGLGYLACCGFVLFAGAPFTLLLNYAVRAIVLDETGPIEGIRRAWHLMMDNLKNSLIILVLSYGLGLAAGLGTLTVVGLISIPAIIAWIITAARHFSLSGIIISSLLSLLPLVAGIVIQAAVNTYFSTYWTIVYRKLSGQEEAGMPAPAPGFVPGSPSQANQFPSPAPSSTAS